MISSGSLACLSILNTGRPQARHERRELAGVDDVQPDVVAGLHEPFDHPQR